jgi:hypothetical protein
MSGAKFDLVFCAACAVWKKTPLWVFIKLCRARTLSAKGELIMMDKMAGIVKIFEVSNMKTKVQLQLLQMFDMFQQQGVDEEVISAIKTSLGIDGVLKSLMSIWAKYYSAEDLTGLLQFYQTPAGKKMLEIEPIIQKETEMAFQQLLQASMEG